MPEFPQPIENDALPVAVMDYVTLTVLGREARESLTDARLRRVVGLDDGSIVLVFDSFRSDCDANCFTTWLLNADSRQFRFHPWPDPVPERSHQSHLLEVLSHHLSGATVRDVTVTWLERILIFHFVKRDITGEKTSFRLIAELMGKHSNIIVVDFEDVILATHKPVHSFQSRVREIRAGKAYTPPPRQDRIEPREFSVSEWSDFINSANTDTPCDDHLSRTFLGMSNGWARSICDLAGIHPEKPVPELKADEQEKLRISLADTLELVKDGIPLTGEDSEDFVRRVTSDFMERAEDISLNHARMEIARVIDRRRKKLQSLEKGLRKDLDSSGRAGEYKKKADILMANQHQVFPGTESVELEDWETGERVQLTLDPHLAPHLQAEKWYSRYRKLNRTQKVARERLNTVEAEAEEILELEKKLAIAASIDEIDSLREECVIRGYVAPAKNAGKSGTKKTSGKEPGTRPGSIVNINARRYRSNDGFLILAGTNDRSNDALRRAASPNDIWLHTREIPGAHVYITTRGKEVPDTTLKEAAIIAAWHSKARDGSNVPVDYTRVKYLQPIPGGPAGKVRFRRERTLRVTPDEKRINMMRLMAGED